MVARGAAAWYRIKKAEGEGPCCCWISSMWAMETPFWSGRWRAGPSVSPCWWTAVTTIWSGTIIPRRWIPLRRRYAGDFLRKQGVDHLDLLLVTHFHRDHIGGLHRVLEAVTVDRLLTTYLPPAGAGSLRLQWGQRPSKGGTEPAAMLVYVRGALRAWPDKIRETVVLGGERMEHLRLTEELSMDILFGEPALYPRQKAVYDAAFRGERNGYDLNSTWAKCMNAPACASGCTITGRKIVLGGDAYAHMWETETATPCDILKVPHHASLSSTTRKLLHLLRPCRGGQRGGGTA